MDYLKSQSEQAHRKSPQQPPPANSRIQGHDSQERPRHVQRQQHQKNPQPAKRPHDPRKCAGDPLTTSSTNSARKDQIRQLFPMILRSVLASRTKTTASDCTSASHVACETQRGRLDIAPHGALGGFAQATAALVASAPTSSSGVGRLGDGGCSDIGKAGRGRVRRGGHPNRCQSRTRHLERGKPQRLALVQEPQKLHQKAAECPMLQQTRERHGRGAAEREGLVGSS